MRLRPNCDECESSAPCVRFETSGWKTVCKACLQKALALFDAPPLFGLDAGETRLSQTPPTLPDRRAITCIATVSPRGVEVVVSGMARIVDPQLLPDSVDWDIATGDAVCVTLDAFNQIVSIAPGDD